MKIRAEVAPGMFLEFEHAALGAIAQGIVRATEENVLLRDLLAACHHELTTYHGLYAHDGDPAQVWRLDCKELLDKLSAASPR